MGKKKEEPAVDLVAICDFMEEYAEYQKRGRGPTTHNWRRAQAQLDNLQIMLGRAIAKEPEGEDNGAESDTGD